MSNIILARSIDLPYDEIEFAPSKNKVIFKYEGKDIGYLNLIFSMHDSVVVKNLKGTFEVSVEQS